MIVIQLDKRALSVKSLKWKLIEGERLTDVERARVGLPVKQSLYSVKK